MAGTPTFEIGADCTCISAGRSVFRFPCRLPFHSATRQNVQYIPDRLLTISEFRQRQVALHLIAIATTFSLLDDVAGVCQIVDDGVGVPFGDAEIGRNVAQTYFRIVSDREQNSTVVGEKAPVTHQAKITEFMEIYC
jgi:hypothetical protein